ncbi:MAG TPA: ester cyclase [Chloroflexia bacterium]|nr:ester cyclase [Chloroflexia bacterium]
MDLTMPNTTIQERLKLDITPELYDKIRRLWIKHSIAEDRRDLQGLIDTLAEDCIYEVLTTGQRWEGHDGARSFYTEFLGAFPDIDFKMTDIVIGPQGVMEVADVTGTHKGKWAGVEPTGKPVKFQVVIYFPWNPLAEKFGGEKVWVDQSSILQES